MAKFKATCERDASSLIEEFCIPIGTPLMDYLTTQGKHVSREIHGAEAHIEFIVYRKDGKIKTLPMLQVFGEIPSSTTFAGYVMHKVVDIGGEWEHAKIQNRLTAEWKAISKQHVLRVLRTAGYVHMVEGE
jgi:hypothetical protein